MSDNERLYRVFTRTWWRLNPKWSGGLEPCPGRKSYRGHPDRLTYSEAQRYCAEWLKTHPPGKLSRKAEFEER